MVLAVPTHHTSLPPCRLLLPNVFSLPDPVLRDHHRSVVYAHPSVLIESVPSIACPSKVCPASDMDMSPH